MTKTIDTLLEDVYSLLIYESSDIFQNHLDRFLSEVNTNIIQFLEEDTTEGRGHHLRLSKIGTGDRRLWFEHHHPLPERQINVMSEGANMMRFLNGHLSEALLLFLAREAGHTVEHEQIEVDINGVLGHCDAVIDGHLVDVKTASHWGYMKFANGGILGGEDPYGYIPQLSAYYSALSNSGVELKQPSYFWVYNKSNSEMLLTEVPKDAMINAEARVKRCQEVVEMNTPPVAKCYNSEPLGQSGNRVLNKNCTWCPFKEVCWENANNGKGLRKFQYAKEVKYFTKVAKEPNVPEI